MPVNTPHAEYSRQAPVWKTCRDVAGGQRSVHAGGEAYLPKLKGETDADYVARLARALFFNATWRTIAGIAGMLMRKDPTVKVSPIAEPMLEDVTQSGLSLAALSVLAAYEGLTVGRMGVLVDYPREIFVGAPATVAEAEARNLRPKMAVYLAEAIINWRREWVRNKCVVSRVVLKEAASVATVDEFEEKAVVRYRVLDLAQPALEPGENPETLPALAYRVRVFEESANKGTWALVEGPFFPRMNGARLDYIPFSFLGVDHNTPDVEEPPLVDLVYTNLSHFKSTADVEHGAHKTALPQPYVTGISNDPGPGDDPLGAKSAPTFYMGGAEIWLHPDVNGTFGMLEYTGQGLEAIEKRLERKERHMAVLGARMLEDQKKAVETAEVAGMHRSGEHATLASQGKTISRGLRQALAWFDEWAGGTGKVEFALNDEFLPASLTPEQLAALVGAWQSGALSPEELFRNMQKGGVIRETIDYETHASQVANQPPLLQAGAPADDPAAGGKQPPAAA